MATNPLADGSAELKKALKQLSDMTSMEWQSVLKASVRNPMNRVLKTARTNLSAISPGKAEGHYVYTGRWVHAGFAIRSLRLIVQSFPKKGVIRAILGVKKEAYYVLAFFELGTSKIPRQPWLTPAFEQSKDTALRDIGDAMRKRIVRIAMQRALKAAKGKK